MSYLKTFLTISFLLFTASTSKYTSAFDVVRENNIAFKADNNLIDDYGLQYFIEIMDKNMHSIEGYNKDTCDFKSSFIPLDLYHYWGKKGDEDYYVIINKAFYLMEKPVSYFSEKRLTDEKFIQATLPHYEIKKVSKEKFHIDCGSFAPEFDYDLSYYYAPFTDHKAKDIIEYIRSQNPEYGDPGIITIQHNYNFSKVLFHKTSKMSVAVYAYYPYRNNKTLVLNYTLNYVHNLPPKLFGGYKFMMHEIITGMKDLVGQTRKVCEYNL